MALPKTANLILIMSIEPAANIQEIKRSDQLCEYNQQNPNPEKLCKSNDRSYNTQILKKRIEGRQVVGR